MTNDLLAWRGSLYRAPKISFPFLPFLAFLAFLAFRAFPPFQP